MSRYAAAHASLNGPGDARPTALQIVEYEGLTDKLTDKDGKEFLLKEPTGDGLPSRGYDPGQVSSYRPHHYCPRIANRPVGDLPSAATE